MGSNPFAGQSIAGLYDNALKSAAAIAGTKLETDTSRLNQRSKNFVDMLNQGIVTANNAVQSEANRQAEQQLRRLMEDRADQRLSLQKQKEVEAALEIYKGKLSIENEIQAKKSQELQEAVDKSALDDDEKTHFANVLRDKELLTSTKKGKDLYFKSMGEFVKSSTNVEQAISYAKRLDTLYDEVENAGGTLKIRPPNLLEAVTGRLAGPDNAQNMLAAIKEDNIIMSNGSLSPERARQIKSQIVSYQNQIKASMTGINRNIFEQVGTQTALDFDIGLRSILSDGNTIDTLKTNLKTGIDRFEAMSATSNLFYGNTGRFNLHMKKLHDRDVYLDDVGTPKSFRDLNNPQQDNTWISNEQLQQEQPTAQGIQLPTTSTPIQTNLGQEYVPTTSGELQFVNQSAPGVPSDSALVGGGAQSPQDVINSLMETSKQYAPEALGVDEFVNQFYNKL